MTNEEAKVLVESLMPLQNQGEQFPCPRCGCLRMEEKAVLNSLSRRANVYICNVCGQDEALRDAAGLSPWSLCKWALPVGFSRALVEELP